MKTKLAKTFAIGALAVALSVAPLSAVGPTPTADAAEQGVSQPYESIFAGDRIIDVKVTIEDEDWESILASPLDKDYKSVTVEVDGNVLENVGFSTKGNLTLRSVASMEDSDRYSFRLKFDKFDKSQTLLGLDKMALNNNYSDPSFLREYLHYEALRAIGLDAPQTVFTNLYINGELYGFYLGVEAIDDSYLLRNYGEDYADGVLYEADQGTTLLYEEDGAYKTLTEDLGSDPDKALLRQFIQTLNEMPDGQKGDIESVLNVDSALQYIAANMVLGNYDSYNSAMGHNFSLYSDAKGVFTVVPWDFNMSFNGFPGGGGRGGSGTQTNTTAINVSIDEPVLGVAMERVPLINNLLQVPEYKAKYLTYVSELVDYLAGVEKRANELADLIRPSVTADPTKFYTMEQFESNLVYDANEQTSGGMGMFPPDGFDGMTLPEGWTPGAGEGLTPPEGWTPGAGEGWTPPEGWVPGDGGEGAFVPGQGGFGGGGGLMTAGSLVTFALNRLANLQEQLGLEVIDLPQADPTTTTPAAPTETTATPPATETKGGIGVTLGGTSLRFGDQQPVIVDGRLLVPLRELIAALGGTINWDATTRTVSWLVGDTKIALPIGQKTATVNGTQVTISAGADILNGRTLVPARFIVETLGMTANWDQAAQQLTITATTDSPAA
ncbi:hypothetical protein PA598K_06947 [Paenibacillus sp. 598K]|uniref:CotH kinase family protein n=1 Tax=Paenibacillus sp. 598K TaxID=1117987 RepID=UPI000FF9D75E|nr:CotH kinase family protein [Paenibacillus sp. 598K]GBF78318.1 hypothetical protein PA598K_06947 [Paenibacillus sp. 598K]